MQKEAIIITFNIASQGERASEGSYLKQFSGNAIINDNAILSVCAGPDGMEYE